MPLTITCPNCDARLDAPDDIEGKKVKCRKCGEKFRARPVEEDDQDDPPTRSAPKFGGKSRRRPADDDGEDDRPPRRDKASRRRENVNEDDRDKHEDRPQRRSRDEDDEEDKPRARKKKGKKKKTDRGVVIIISATAAMMLLTFAMGALFSSDPEVKGSVTADGPGSGPSTDGAESAADAALPGWFEFADPKGQYKVRMPRMAAAPTKQQWTVPSGEPAEATIYTVEIGGGLYAVASLNLPGRDAKTPADDPILDDAMAGGMGWLRGAVVKSRSNIKHQGFPGRQAILEYPGVKGSTVVRVIVAGNRMFWLLAKGDNFTAETPKVQGFFDSLKIN